MFQCSDCGNDSFFKESENVTRCSACFSKVSSTETPLKFSKKPLERQPSPPNNKHEKPKSSIFSLSNRKILSYLFYFALSFSYVFFWEDILNFFQSTNNASQNPTAIVIEPETNISTEPETIEVSNDDFSLEEITLLPDIIGNVYFVGYVKNNAKIPVEKPRIDLNFYDKKNNLVGTTFGYAVKGMLLPDEKSMIQILYKNAKKYDRYEATVSSSKLYYERIEPELTLVKANLKKIGDDWKLVGRVKNPNDYSVQYVQVSYFLRDKKKKIRIYNTHYLQNNTLGPNEEADFNFEIYEENLQDFTPEINLQALKK